MGVSHVFNLWVLEVETNRSPQHCESMKQDGRDKASKIESQNFSNCSKLTDNCDSENQI